jgi:hypothetical protein
MTAAETKKKVFPPGENEWKLVRWAMFILLQEFPDHQDEIKEFALQVINWAGPGNETIFDSFEDYLKDCSAPNGWHVQMLLNVVGEFFAKRPVALSDEKTQWICRIGMLQKIIQDYQADKLSHHKKSDTL